MNPSNRIAVCPGSYDPVTNGHLDVIGRAARMFDAVIVAVVNLPVRKGKTLFTAEERCGFIAGATSDLDNVTAKPFSKVAFHICCQSDRRSSGLRPRSSGLSTSSIAARTPARA